jgi:hypothetical protein
MIQRSSTAQLPLFSIATLAFALAIQLRHVERAVAAVVELLDANLAKMALSTIQQAVMLSFSVMKVLLSLEFVKHQSIISIQLTWSVIDLKI